MEAADGDSLVFCFMILAFTYRFPESPRWLAMKGKTEEARAAMRALAGDDADPDVIEVEILSFSRIAHEESSHERGFVDLFKPSQQKLFYRFCLALGINFCAQMTGANVITYYATTIFKESLKLPSHEASLLAAGVLTWKIIGACTAFLTVDRVGRKPLFMIAGLGMGVSMAGLAGTVYDIKSKSSSIAATFFLFMFMAFFPLGFLGSNFLYSAEIAPQDLRVHLAAVGTASHWIWVGMH